MVLCCFGEPGSVIAGVLYRSGQSGCEDDFANLV